MAKCCAGLHLQSNSLQQIFRRLVFNILIGNTDAHEKNHALLRLVPGASDFVAGIRRRAKCPRGLGRQQLLVGDTGSDPTLDNALSQSLQFGLKKDRATTLITEVARAVETWHGHFKSLGVRASDLDILAQYLDGQNVGVQRGDWLKAPVAAARPTVQRRVR